MKLLPPIFHLMLLLLTDKLRIRLHITVVTVLQNVRMIYILAGNRRPAKKLNKN